MNGDTNVHTENGFKSIFCVGICVTMLKLTLTLTQTQTFSVNKLKYQTVSTFYIVAIKNTESDVDVQEVVVIVRFHSNYGACRQINLKTTTTSL